MAKVITMILSDRDIREYLESRRLDIIPLSFDTVRENGVDLKVGNEIARLRPTRTVINLDENKKIEDVYEIEKGNAFTIQPHEHVLLTTMERVSFPNDLVGLVNLRSTFARLGLVVPPTVIDAGFSGQITIEVVGSEFPVQISAGTRFIHVVIARTLSPVERPYSGKYAGQSGVTPPRK